MSSREERRKWGIPEEPGSLSMIPAIHHAIVRRIIAGEKMYVKIQDFEEGRRDLLHIVYAIPLNVIDGNIFFDNQICTLYKIGRPYLEYGWPVNRPFGLPYNREVTIEEITRDQYDIQVERRRKFGIIESDRELAILKHELCLLKIRELLPRLSSPDIQLEINSLESRIEYKILSKMREMDF